MERTKPIKRSGVIEDLHHLQLMALLNELVRKRGYTGAARELKIHQKTISSSMKAGRLSDKTRWALEKALQYGVGSAAAEQRERNDKLVDRLDKLEGQIRKLKNELRSSLKRLRMSLDGVRKYYGVQRRLIEQRLSVLESGHDGLEMGTRKRDESAISSTSSGPPLWDPSGIKEQPSADITELISERGQAVASLMNVEERLRVAEERDGVPLDDRDDRLETPAEPWNAGPIRLSRRRRTHSWAKKRTQIAPEE